MAKKKKNSLTVKRKAKSTRLTMETQGYTPSPDELEETAIHEAGHAIMHLALQLGLKSSRDSRRMGCVIGQLGFLPRI